MVLSCRLGDWEWAVKKRFSDGLSVHEEYNRLCPAVAAGSGFDYLRVATRDGESVQDLRATYTPLDEQRPEMHRQDSDPMAEGPVVKS
jgi:hypothetical protein